MEANMHIAWSGCSGCRISIRRA